MLREWKNVEKDGVSIRRWFADDFFDLIVWLDADEKLSGFQLCYDKLHDEHALTWLKGRGFVHDQVDDGEQGTWNYAPVLIPDGAIPWERLNAELMTRGQDLPPEILQPILNILAGGGGNKCF